MKTDYGTDGTEAGVNMVNWYTKFVCMCVCVCVCVCVVRATTCVRVRVLVCVCMHASMHAINTD